MTVQKTLLYQNIQWYQSLSQNDFLGFFLRIFICPVGVCLFSVYRIGLLQCYLHLPFIEQSYDILTVLVLSRGGRKPLGFLSLICTKSNSESAEDTKGNRGKIQKPRIVTPKRNLKKPTPSTKDERESCSFPSTSSSVEHEHVAADATVTVWVYFWTTMHFWGVKNRELVVSGVSRWVCSIHVLSPVSVPVDRFWLVHV